MKRLNLNTFMIKFTPDHTIGGTTVTCGPSLFEQSKPLPENQAPNWGPKVLALDGGGMRGVVSLEPGMHNILYLLVMINLWPEIFTLVQRKLALLTVWKKKNFCSCK